MLRIPFVLGLLALAACASIPPPPANEPIEWSAVAHEGTPQIVTTDPDGSLRETPIWIVVLEHEGYIRTGGSRWFANIERDPRVKLRIGGWSYPLRAQLVTDPALRKNVNRAFREKYGFSDFLIHPRGAPGANILRLESRSHESPGGAR